MHKGSVVSSGRRPFHVPRANRTETQIERTSAGSVSERLESRRLLTIALVDHVLYASGTKKGDRIDVAMEPRDLLRLIVNVNRGRERQTFAAAEVSRIELYGGDGHDRIVIDESLNPFPIAARIMGGHGGDTIVGGSGNDEFFGENESDSIVGGDGNDLIYGGNENDTIVAGRGRDTVWAGEDEDLVVGNAGNDQLYGEDGRDTVDGGAGDDLIRGNWHSNDKDYDSLLGGSGNDRLEANRGDDYLEGGPGNDTLVGGQGDDTMLGGAGNDDLVGNDDADVLDGGSGSDLLMGNAGRDWFKNVSSADNVVDYILDEDDSRTRLQRID